MSECHFFYIQVSHMFALNGNPENPSCTGIDDIIEVYKSAVNAVQLSQPTCVAPLINHVASLAEQAMQDPITQVNSFNQGQKQTLPLRLIINLVPAAFLVQH